MAELGYLRSKRYYVWRGPYRQKNRPFEAGFTHNIAHSDGTQAVFTTDCPFAAVPFWDIATPAAREQLKPYRREYVTSFAAEPSPGFMVPCPPGERYLPYQLAAIEYALRRTNVLFGDEPGLGKTVEALGLANALGLRRLLVVCPGSVRLQWQAMARLWIVGKKPVRTHVILKSSDGVNPVADVVIISYDLLRNKLLRDVLARKQWDLLVLDEAHYLKNYEAARTKAVFGSKDGLTTGISASAERIAALTGTPLPNRPREAYTLARGLDFEAIDWISEEKFQDRFNASVERTNRAGDVVGRIEKTGRLPELQARLRVNFMIRRHKKDVLKDLPAKIYELAFLEKNGAIKKALQAERMINLDPDTLDLSDPVLFGHISTIRKFMGVAKAPKVVEHIHTLFASGRDKITLFAHHREVIALLRKELARYRPAIITGGMAPGPKNAQVQRFRKEKACKLFLGSALATGTGVDGLQDVCDIAVLAEPSWVPGDNEQCIDRLHRVGQGGSVFAQFLVVEGSLDAKIIGAHIKKQSSIDVALDAQRVHS